LSLIQKLFLIRNETLTDNVAKKGKLVSKLQTDISELMQEKLKAHESLQVNFSYY
jgi:hypothetical protein